MVSPLNGPGQPPGINLPVPADTRAVVAADRAEEAAAAGRPEGPSRRAATRVEAVAIPPGASGDRTNPFLERRPTAPRLLSSEGPSSGFLAQFIGQAGGGAPGAGEAASGAAAEGARIYRDVQDVVDRAAASPRPGRLDIIA